MKRGSTLFLRLVVYFLAAASVAIASFAVWLTYSAEGGNGADYRPLVACMSAALIPFLAAQWQALRLLGLIDAGSAFSDLAVGALGSIKRCGVAISAVFLLVSPLAFAAAQRDDAPGVVLIVLVIASASAVIATFAAVLQRLLKGVVDLKAESDMTV